jgi:hypothetical protein
MNNHDLPDPDQQYGDRENGDHWEMFAEAMDLTIEGHRLIAQEIVYEAKLAWRNGTDWLRGLIGMTSRRGSSPPV